MDANRIQQFLSYLGVGPGVERDRWVSTSCPFAFAKHKGGKDSNPSFGITIEDEKQSMYNCFACHSKGPLDALLHELAHLSRGHPQAKKMRLADAFAMLEQQTDEAYYGSDTWLKTQEAEHPYTPFPTWFLQNFKHACDVPRALVYLRSRGVNKRQALQEHVLYDRPSDRIVVPWFARDGTLAGVRGRSIEGKQYHDYRHNGVSNVGHVWMGESSLDTASPVVVVEGMFDWLAVRRHYRNVVANLSTGVSKAKAMKLVYCPLVAVFLDHDEGGLKGSKTLAEALRGHVPVVTLPYPPEALLDGRTDPGSLYDGELVDALATIDDSMP